MTNESNNKLVLVIGAFVSFFLFGLIDNIKGTTMPPLLAEFGFVYAQGGLIFSGVSIGFLIATLVSGPINDRFGNKLLILVGGILVLVGTFGYSLSAALIGFFLGMLVMGFGFGSIEVGANALIADLFRDSAKSGKYLLLLGFCHSLGATIGPLLAGQLLENQVGWSDIYQLSLIPLVVFIVYVLFMKSPRIAAEETGKPKERHLKKIIFSDGMPWFFLMIFAYSGIEIGISSWAVEYLQKSKLLSVSESSALLSMFFGGIMIGRLLLSFVIEKIGYIRTMTFATVFSVVAIGIVASGPASLSFFLGISGFFLSVMFPTVTAAVSEISDQHLGMRLGLLFACAGMGGILGPYILGFVSDRVSMQSAFGPLFIVLHIMILVSLAAVSIRKLKSPAITSVKLNVK